MLEPGTRTATAAAPRDLGVAEFARLFGVAPETLAAACRDAIGAHDFRHVVIGGGVLAAVERQVARTLAEELPVAGPLRLQRWEDGWDETLRGFVASGCRPEELLPQYYRRARAVMRLEGAYVLPFAKRFEAQVLAVVQTWIATTFLADVPAVYEFGCGPGHNLVAFARLFPAKRYVGLDWATASQAIVARAASALGLDLVGRRFDMFAPDPTVEVVPGAAVVTIGGMEQLGTRFAPFLDFVRAAAPAVCVHVEPIHELYDRGAPFDDVAARYAEKRGYLQGYLTRLRALAAAGEVELPHVKKILGSLYHDGWTAVVWRPAGTKGAKR